jgi:hypothetical protein
LDFKRKGNNWVSNGKIINKIVNLQKSQYSNSYYINYGYILNSLPLDNFTYHIDNRLASKDKSEQELITDLLNLENNIDSEKRLVLLANIINSKIVEEIKSISKEEDILRILKAREHFYTIPPFVLKYFDLRVNPDRSDMHNDSAEILSVPTMIIT